MIIDFSNKPTVQSITCTNNSIFLPIYVIDEWKKVNLGERIDDSGLSEYSTRRGLLIVSSFNDALHLFPLIAKVNPRANVLIQLDVEYLKDAKTLLEAAFQEHKILNVAVAFMHFETTQVSRLSMSLCLFNPFYGDAAGRRPKFKIFNFTDDDPDFTKVENFIRMRVNNLHKYPLRVYIFEDTLVSKAIRNEHGVITRYSYADGDTVVHLSEIMNFTPIYINPNDSSKFGYQLSNGTFTGSLGAIEYDKADFSAVAIFNVDYGTKNSLFLHATTTKKLLFLTQKRDVFKIFLVSVFYAFDTASTIISICICMLFPTFYVLINRMESKIKNCKTKTFGRDLIYIIGLLNNISSRHSKLVATRIVVATILFYATVISALFQGTIIQNLNYNEQSAAITTVNQLLKENYVLTMDSTTSTIFREQGGSELGEKLKTVSLDPNKVFNVSRDGYEAVKANKKVAFLSTNLVLASLNKYYDNKTGENIYEAVPETVFEFYVSPMVPKHSPFIETFNYWLLKYREVGIRIYQMQRALNDVDNAMVFRVKNGFVSKLDHHVIQLHDLVSIFYLYLLLSAICVAAFIVEIVYAFLIRNHRKNA